MTDQRKSENRCDGVGHRWIIYFGVLNLGIITFTSHLECSCFNLYLKQISFLYIRTLHNDCSHIEDVQLRRRSRAEFGLVSIMWLASSGDVGCCRIMLCHSLTLCALETHKRVL